MKFKIGISFIIGIVSFCFSQRHELGITLGSPNIIGDIGKTNYIQPIPINSNGDISFTGGINYRYNPNPRQSYRLNLLYNTIKFDDRLAFEDYRYARGLYDKNDILEASAVFEYYFFDINDEHEFAVSPYIFGGLGFAKYNSKEFTYNYEFYRDSNGDKIVDTSRPDYFNSYTTYDKNSETAFALNFGVGLKVKFNYNWIFFAEVGFRPTNVDNLDYSYTKLQNIQQNIVDDELLTSPFYEEVQNRFDADRATRQTGNPKTNDWYVVSGIGIAYAFGRPPCYCD
ncbi:MAG: outer membrane beta-barrel protein [Flavobacteriales bacterium]|nr:outer membrane beta-barrel protein [Flavobacteriales bacterium]